MPENRDEIKAAEKYPGQYDGMFDEYEGPPAGFGDGHQTHFSALPIKLRDTGWDDGWEWFQVSPGRYKCVKKRLRADVQASEEHERGLEDRRKRRTRRRVGVEAPTGAN